MTNTTALQMIGTHLHVVTLSPLAQVLNATHAASCSCLTGNTGI